MHTPRPPATEAAQTEFLRGVPDPLVPDIKAKPFETHFEGIGNNQILFIMAQNIYLQTFFLKCLSPDKCVQVAHCEIQPQRRDRCAAQSPTLEVATGRTQVERTQENSHF